MRVLDGIRVVDWTQWGVGPWAGQILTDFGAETIHVEQRGRGDSMRGLQAFFGQSLILPGGRQTLFEDQNRGKKSLAVDLNKPEGREIVYRLVEKSDVFLTNFRVSVARKLGMDEDTILKKKPNLIYAGVTGFGPKGPHTERPSMEIIGYAASGLMSNSGDEGMPPVYISQGLGDRIPAIWAALGVIAALLVRERKGVTQKVYASQLMTAMDLQRGSIAPAIHLGTRLFRHNRKQSGNPLYCFYECKDGRWIALSLIPQSRYWPVFCRVMGIQELEKDPRFADDEGKKKNGAELVKILDKIFITRPAVEWDAIFQKEDMLASMIKEIGELPDDPQVVANNYFKKFDHPVLGPWRVLDQGVQLEKTPAEVRTAAPELGQHNEEILTEICGYSWEEIEQLAKKGAI